MGKPLDLTGKVFGDLVVIELGTRVFSGGKSKRRWVCKCTCGVVKEIKVDALVTAKQTACGCKSGKITHGHTRKKDYKTTSPTHLTWTGMKHRCHNPKHTAYERYGAKGVHVCEEWRKSFVKFLADMGERPKGMTLDRIDSSKGYFKENCRWATTTEQYQNKRVVRDKLGKFSKLP